MNSAKWKQRRKEYLSKEPRCFVCGSVKNINVHHNSYVCLGNEPDDHLVTLCRDHHGLTHWLSDDRGVPLETAHLVAKESVDSGEAVVVPKWYWEQKMRGKKPKQKKTNPKVGGPVKKRGASSRNGARTAALNRDILKFVLGSSGVTMTHIRHHILPRKMSHKKVKKFLKRKSIDGIIRIEDNTYYPA